MPISNGADGSSQADWLTPRRFALLLLALVVASFPQVVFGLQTFIFRDFGIFSYPQAFHLHECFWRGELPLWNPLNCCGMPFLAQWNTQVVYPPALFYMLLPVSWSLGVFCLLHLYWGGLGMFLLAERWTGNHLAAAFAGIVFAFSGLMFNSLVWPATVAGLGWMPWVLLLTERAWRQGGISVPLAALAGAFQMLSGGVEAVMMCWILLGAFWLVDFIRGAAPRGKMPVRAGLVILLISGLSAAQLLPFFELLANSRMQQSISSAMWPMAVNGWANFLTPLFHCYAYQGIFMQATQSWVNSYYAGVVTVALALAAFWLARRDWRVWPMGALTLLCLVLAVGEATPIYGWLSRHFNVVGLMRFPVKFVILPVFVLPLLAAYSLSKITFNPVNPSKGRLVVAGFWLTMVTVILTLTFWPESVGLSAADRQTVILNGLMRAVYFTAIVVIWWSMRKLSGPGLKWWQILFLLLVWIDLFRQMPLPPTVSRAVYAPGLARSWSPPQPGAGRVKLQSAANDAFYHSMLSDVTADYLARRFSLMANCNLLDGIPKCDGFSPLYVSCYVALFFNVYHDSQPAESLLDFLGVAQTFVAHDGKLDWQARGTYLPLLTAGQKPYFADDLTALQRLTNADFNSRLEVVLPTAAKPFITASNAVMVKIGPVTYADQRIEARLETPAPTLVVAAQTYYPDWHAYVDGQPARVWAANYAFQGFEIPAGTHQVQLIYEDRRFRVGVMISLGSLAACLVLYMVARRQKQNKAT